jgi:nitrous oxidase accessory protein NosD
LRVAPQDGDFASVAEALKHAPPGTRIVVKPGTYTDPVVIDRFVEIVGDGAPGSVVLETADSACLDMQTDRATVRGFTLRSRGKQSTVVIGQGRLTLEDCDITGESQPGVTIYGTATDPTLRRCKVHNTKGPAVQVYGKARGTLEHCDVVDNGLGILVKEGAEPLVTECNILRNQSVGVYFMAGGGGTLELCQVIGNGIGVSVQDAGSAPQVRRCTLAKNRGAGLYVALKSQPTAYKCTIEENDASGIMVTDSGTHLFAEGCTIQRNKGPRDVVVGNNAGATFAGCGITNQNSLIAPGSTVEIREDKE